MSLINDALKRIGAHTPQEQKKPLPLMQPVEKLQRRTATPNYIALSLLLFIVSLIFAGMWAMNKFFNKEKYPQISSVKTPTNDQNVKKILDNNLAKTGATVNTSQNKKPVDDLTTSNNINPLESQGIKNTQSDRTINLQTQYMIAIKQQTNNTRAGSDKPNKAQLTDVSKGEAKENVTVIMQPAEERNTKVTLETNLPFLAQPAIKTNLPPAEPVIQFPQLKLNGIFYRPSNPSAIINGRLINKGDIIEGAKIISIDRNAVTVEFSNQTRILRM
jgi:hypothetical protein